MGKGSANPDETERILSDAQIQIHEIHVANKPPDDCVSRYSAILNKPQARKRDVTMLKDWISRPDLGGGIPFSGDDLSPLKKNVYDDTFVDDIMILNNRAGESDPFTRMLAGPVFHGCEKVLRYMKVCWPYFRYSSTNGRLTKTRNRFNLIQKIKQQRAISSGTRTLISSL